jgi:hypothetical protein
MTLARDSELEPHHLYLYIFLCICDPRKLRDMSRLLLLAISAHKTPLPMLKYPQIHNLVPTKTHVSTRHDPTKPALPCAPSPPSHQKLPTLPYFPVNLSHHTRRIPRLL